MRFLSRSAPTLLVLELACSAQSPSKSELVTENASEAPFVVAGAARPRPGHPPGPIPSVDAPATAERGWNFDPTGAEDGDKCGGVGDTSADLAQRADECAITLTETEDRGHGCLSEKDRLIAKSGTARPSCRMKLEIRGRNVVAVVADAAIVWPGSPVGAVW